MSIGINIEPNEDLRSGLDDSFIRNDDKINRWGNVISSFQNIPNLVGFWPMSSVQRSTGNTYDLSGQARTLTYNGTPTYNIYKDFIPYIEFRGPGSGDFLNRPDETDLDILGTKTIYDSAIRGITVGGWFWFNTPSSPATLETLIAKDGLGALGTRAWQITRILTGEIFFTFRDSVGTAYNSGLIPDTPNHDEWHFIVATVDIANGIEYMYYDNLVNATLAVGNNIVNSTADLTIGGNVGGLRILDGRAALCFLSASFSSASFINGLRQQSLVLFR